MEVVEPQPNRPKLQLVNPNIGFCSKTMTFHNIRPPIALPTESALVSLTNFLFSTFQSSPPSPTVVVLIDATSRRRIPYSELVFRSRNLVTSLCTRFNLSKGDCAFVFTPNNIYTPILYLSLLSLGVVISPINPAATIPDILRLIQLSKPVIVFASSDLAHKVPSFKHGVVVIDSAEFESLMRSQSEINENRGIKVKQSDVAAILYSFDTTGQLKAVASL